MLNLLYQAGMACESKRFERGAFRVPKHDIHVKYKDGVFHLEEIIEDSPARSMIGEFMIFANELSSQKFKEENLPAVYRTQELAEIDQELINEIPDGLAYDYAQRTKLKPSKLTQTPGPHAMLGLGSYTQLSSPIRRYLDLALQRQLKHFLLTGETFYSSEDIDEIMGKANESVKRSIMCSREQRRIWFLHYLKQRAKTNPVIEGTILRNDNKKALVELHELYMTTLIKLPSEQKPGDILNFHIAAVHPLNDYLKITPA